MLVIREAQIAAMRSAWLIDFEFEMVGRTQAKWAEWSQREGHGCVRRMVQFSIDQCLAKGLSRRLTIDFIDWMVETVSQSEVKWPDAARTVFLALEARESLLKIKAAKPRAMAARA